jgi:hypothetical protein
VAYAHGLGSVDTDYDTGAIDAFTAWILDWQDWIIAFLAVVIVASILI